MYILNFVISEEQAKEMGFIRDSNGQAMLRRDTLQECESFLKDYKNMLARQNVPYKGGMFYYAINKVVKSDVASW